MYKKQGYLNEKFHLFYLNDISDNNYSFHYHDFYKIIFFIKGKVSYSIEGLNYELNPCDIVLVGKNEIHCPFIDSNSVYERYILYLSQSILDEDSRLSMCFKKAKEEHKNVTRLVSKDYNVVLELLNESSRLLNQNTFGSDFYAKLKIYELLLKLNESIDSNGLEYNGNVHYNPKIIDICEYINNHLGEDLSVDTLSGMIYLSKYYFMRLFKEHTGISVHQYILEKRVLYTKALIESGKTISESCLLAGFKDYSTYLRASKKNKLKKDTE